MSITNETLKDIDKRINHKLNPHIKSEYEYDLAEFSRRTMQQYLYNFVFDEDNLERSGLYYLRCVPPDGRPYWSRASCLNPDYDTITLNWSDVKATPLYGTCGVGGSGTGLGFSIEHTHDLYCRICKDGPYQEA